MLLLVGGGQFPVFVMAPALTSSWHQNHKKGKCQIFWINVCYVVLSFIIIDQDFLFLASSQNIQIQAQPPTVNVPENDLVILCSISNPSQLTDVFFIQLEKNTSTIFETIVSVSGQASLVKWNDKFNSIKNRATATGNLDSPSNAQLRLAIDESVYSVQLTSQCTGVKCLAFLT